MAGLKGTGSGDMVARAVRVPTARSVSLIEDRPEAEGALYAFPAFGLLAVGIAAMAAGNAEAALREVTEQLAARHPPGSLRSASERAMVQAHYAGATARLQAGRALLMDAVHEGWRQAEAYGNWRS